MRLWALVNRTLNRYIHRLETGLDAVKYRLAERLDQPPLTVQSYLGYGTPERFFVMGRVLAVRDYGPAVGEAGAWENLKGTYLRFNSREAPYAQVAVRRNGDSVQLTADEEGYLAGWLPLSEPLEPGHAYAQDIGLELLHPIRPAQQERVFAGRVLVPGSGARFGVISDVDDTVLQTDATPRSRNAFFTRTTVGGLTRNCSHTASTFQAPSSRFMSDNSKMRASSLWVCACSHAPSLPTLSVLRLLSLVMAHCRMLSLMNGE